MPSVRRAIALIFFVLAACLALAAVKAWQNVEAARHPARLDAAVAAEIGASRALVLRYRAFDDGTPRATTRQVEDGFNAGKRLRLRPGGAADGGDDVTVAMIEDPATGGSIDVRFRDGRVFSFGTGDVRLVAPPTLPLGWEAGEAARRALGVALPLAWLAMLVGWRLVRRRIAPRPWFAAQLAVAIGWLIVNLEHPSWYGGPVHPLARPELWLWPPLAIAISFARLRRARDRRRVDPRACRHCGYDLTGNVSGVCPECGTARSIGT